MSILNGMPFSEKKRNTRRRKWKAWPELMIWSSLLQKFSSKVKQAFALVPPRVIGLLGITLRTRRDRGRPCRQHGNVQPGRSASFPAWGVLLPWKRKTRRRNEKRGTYHTTPGIQCIYHHSTTSILAQQKQSMYKTEVARVQFSNTMLHAWDIPSEHLHNLETRLEQAFLFTVIH